MNEIILETNTAVYLLSELIVWFMLLIAFIVDIRLLTRWDYGSFDPEQYELEKRAYLVMTVIIFAFAVKAPLLPYFVFTIDELSALVPGAMCGAGVISANGYGLPLLFVKIVTTLSFVLWLTINHYDLEEGDYPWFRLKSLLFIAVFTLVSVELWLDISFFTHIDTTRPTSCCSALFGLLEGENPLPFGLDTKSLLLLFYTLYLVTVGSIAISWNSMTAISSTLFLYISYYAVVYFFGTYIYQLPTHRCPFCMMQKEYFYVGYIVWGTLLGGYFGILSSLVAETLPEVGAERVKRFSALLLTIFVAVCSAYVAYYYIENGVLL